MSDTQTQLAEALNEFLKTRGAELANGPLDELIVPLKDGGELRVPVLFLLPGDSP